MYAVTELQKFVFTQQERLMAELDDLLEEPKQLQGSSLSSFPSLGWISTFVVDSFTTTGGSSPQQNAFMGNAAILIRIIYFLWLCCRVS